MELQKDRRRAERRRRSRLVFLRRFKQHRFREQAKTYPRDGGYDADVMKTIRRIAWRGKISRYMLLLKDTPTAWNCSCCRERTSLHGFRAADLRHVPLEEKEEDGM